MDKFPPAILTALRALSPLTYVRTNDPDGLVSFFSTTRGMGLYRSLGPAGWKEKPGAVLPFFATTDPTGPLRPGLSSGARDFRAPHPKFATRLDAPHDIMSRDPYQIVEAAR